MTSFLGVTLMVAFDAREILTRHWIEQAVSGSPGEAKNGLKWLRGLRLEESILRECDDQRSRSWLEFFGLTEPAVAAARQVYYRVTGNPFTAAAPEVPGRARQRNGRTRTWDWESESLLGGSQVGPLASGLALKQSRLDATADADRGWGYLEWILEFQNQHPAQAHEARAQIQLPEGAVVSRVTLWVNGEEREAAFAGRGQVREAYQKVAVQQRRDPVLVTMDGHDRVLVQCFPIPAQGGTMKIRLGVTTPVVVEEPTVAAFRLPHFVERNFVMSSALAHGLWLESRQPLTLTTVDTADVSAGSGTLRRRATLTDPELSSSTVRFRLAAARAPVSVLDERSVPPQVIEQSLVARSAVRPGRLALVIDGSENMQPFLSEIQQCLARISRPAAISIWVADEGGAQRLPGTSPAHLAAQVATVRARGGQDNLPALAEAWDWAAGAENGVVLWLHGPQPFLLSNLEPLRQRIERETPEHCVLWDFQMLPGPNRITDGLPDSVSFCPRLGTRDLSRWFARWTEGRPHFEFERELKAGVPGVTGAPDPGHIARLWAYDQIKELIGRRLIPAAVELAGTYQLVTPVSGAVVLETAQQFRDAGLTPVPAASVPAVPEPSTWVMLGMGLIGLWYYRGRCQRGRH